VEIGGINKMKPEDILYEAIKQAEEDGYTEHVKYLPILIKPIKNLSVLMKRIFYLHKDSIIYSHSFAKCYFGDSDNIYNERAWVHRLKEMSQEENDLEYLRKFLKTNKED
jgi:hypothetical protein